MHLKNVPTFPDLSQPIPTYPYLSQHFLTFPVRSVLVRFGRCWSNLVGVSNLSSVFLAKDLFSSPLFLESSFIPQIWPPEY